MDYFPSELFSMFISNFHRFVGVYQNRKCSKGAKEKKQLFQVLTILNIQEVYTGILINTGRTLRVQGRRIRTQTSSLS